MEEDTAVECDRCSDLFDEGELEDGTCASCLEDAREEADHQRVESHPSIFL